MSMLNQMYLLERYGLRLNVEQLAEVMDSTPAAIHRRISDGTLEIQTYIDSKKRYADIRDVAQYMDLKRDAARNAAIRASDLRTA